MTRIKFCGMRSQRDIELCNELKPDYIGFVFAESRRRVSHACAAALKNRLAPGILAVGVFVNEKIDNVVRLCRDGVIDLIQLHGEEDEAYLSALKSRITVPVIRAVRVRDASFLQVHSAADYLLFDAYSSHARGGTGARFDWRLLRGVTRPYFLAGGITAENAVEALTYAPFALDVGSGAETDGVKDGNKMAEIMEIVRSK